jgi:hypothetical protein
VGRLLRVVEHAVNRSFLDLHCGEKVFDVIETTPDGCARSAVSPVRISRCLRLKSAAMSAGPRLELLAVRLIVDPFAWRRDPLTGCDGRGVADNGYDITMPARLGPQHAKAILNIMVRDSFDETGRNFMRLILGRVFHSLDSRHAGLNVAT